MKVFLLQLFTILFLLIGHHISAQQTVITGRILGGAPPAALSGATVVLKETSEATLTNDKGEFSIATSHQGTSTLAISHLGFQSFQSPIVLTQGQNQQVNVTLVTAEINIGEVVVTGTGTEHNIKNAPVQTDVISGKALKEFNGRDIEDVLASLSSSITYSRGDMGSNLKMNGLKNDYILILIDGKRMNGDVGGQTDLSRINLANLERIELVKGAASSLYGSDAIGGVINFITKKNTDKLSVSNKTRVGQYADINQSNTINLNHKKWKTATALDYKQTDGWQNTSQEWYRDKLYTNSVSKSVNRSSNYSIGENLEYRASEKWTLTGNASFYEKWTSRPSGIPQWRLYDFYYQNQDYGLGAKYKLKGRNYLSWDAAYSHADYSYDYTSRKYTDYFDASNNRIVYYSGDRILQYSQKRWSSNLKSVFYLRDAHTLSLGAEYLYDRLLSPYRLKDDQADNYSAEAYGQDEWKLTKKLSLTAGLRVGQHKEFGLNLTPKISAMYKLNDWVVRGNYSRGFKTPTTKELYYHYYASVMSTYKAYYGNTELNPQTSDFFSLNIDYHLPKIKIGMTAYVNNIRNMIALQTIETSYDDKLLLVEQSMKYVNMAKAYTNGVDMTIDIDLPHNFKLGGGYSYIDAKAQRTDDETVDDYLKYVWVSGTSKHNASFRASWSNTWKAYKLGVNINGRYQSKTYYTTDGDAAEYHIWRINTSHRLVNHRQWNLDTDLGIDNVFNHIDRTPIGRNHATTSPGRTVYFSLALTFKNE